MLNPAADAVRDVELCDWAVSSAAGGTLLHAGTHASTGSGIHTGPGTRAGFDSDKGDE